MEEVVTVNNKQYKLITDSQLTTDEREQAIVQIRKQFGHGECNKLITMSKSGTVIKTAMFATPVKQTTSNTNKYEPQFQTVDQTIYYTWQEQDIYNISQIWTATSNLNGSVFTPTKQTTGEYNKVYTQLQVLGSKIYYTWQEQDADYYLQIWIATSNLNGTDFIPVKLTTSPHIKINSNFQIVGSVIYYVWQEDSDIWNENDQSWYAQLWTATSNLDGTAFTAIQQTATANMKDYPFLLKVLGSKIYYLWLENDNSSYYQVMVAKSNLNGTDFIPVKLTTSAYSKAYPQFQVVGSTIYYMWQEHDIGNYSQIWTAASNLDGANFVPIKRTDVPDNKHDLQFQIVGSKIYYMWREFDSSVYQIWTATSNLDGSTFTTTQQTDSIYDKWYPRFQVYGSTAYYIWSEDDGTGIYQIQVANISIMEISCISTPKYSGEDVTLQATPKDGIGPYYIEFRMNNGLIDPSRLGGTNPGTSQIYDAPEDVPIIRVYTLDDLDISSASGGTIDFSVYMEDSCPTGPMSCADTCTVAIGCVAPTCNFTVI